MYDRKVKTHRKALIVEIPCMFSDRALLGIKYNTSIIRSVGVNL